MSFKTALAMAIPLAAFCQAPEPSSPGSLFTPRGRFADLAADFRAARPGDLVTIVVADQASALSRGSTSTARKAESKNSMTNLLGPVAAQAPLAKLAALSGNTKLDGQGQTSRQTSITTTVTARVASVTADGSLVIEGAKDIWVNSERQQVTVRGIARWQDVGPSNQIRSDRLANLEVRVQGKGVVGDAIRRPNFLYRLLLGILPF